MIRWLRQDQSYRFTDSAVASKETQRDTIGPMLNVYNYCLSEEHKTVVIRSRATAVNEKRDAHNCLFDLLTTSKTERREVSTVFKKGQLPLLIMPTKKHDTVFTVASSEAAKTGAVTSTAGAVLGAFVSTFVPGASMLWYAAVGGASSGVIAGGAQYAHCSASNSMRHFADVCNVFLLRARAALEANPAMPVPDAVLLCFEIACRMADTKQKRDLARDIVKVCDHFLVESDVQSMRDAMRGFPPDLPMPNIGHDYRNGFVGAGGTHPGLIGSAAYAAGR